MKYTAVPPRFWNLQRNSGESAVLLLRLGNHFPTMRDPNLAGRVFLCANYALKPTELTKNIEHPGRLYMPQVKVKENEPFEVALRRFKRGCEKAGVVTETRRREFYEKPTQERKRKRAAAVKRHAKKLSRENARRVRMY